MNRVQSEPPPTVSIGASTAIGKPGAINAAIFAAEIIATSDPDMARKLAGYKEQLASSVAEKSEKVKREFQI